MDPAPEAVAAHDQGREAPRVGQRGAPAQRGAQQGGLSEPPCWAPRRRLHAPPLAPLSLPPLEGSLSPCAPSSDSSGKESLGIEKSGGLLHRRRSTGARDGGTDTEKHSPAFCKFRTLCAPGGGGAASTRATSESANSNGHTTGGRPGRRVAPDRQSPRPGTGNSRDNGEAQGS